MRVILFSSLGTLAKNIEIKYKNNNKVVHGISTWENYHVYRYFEL